MLAATQSMLAALPNPLTICAPHTMDGMPAWTALPHEMARSAMRAAAFNSVDTTNSLTLLGSEIIKAISFRHSAPDDFSP